MVKTPQEEKSRSQSTSMIISPTIIPSSQVTKEHEVKSAEVLPAIPSLSSPMESLEWRHYCQCLMDASDQRKQTLAFHFIAAIVRNINKGTIILSDPRQSKQFHQAMQLFWYAIKNTDIAITLLGVLLEDSQSDTFTKLPYSSTQILLFSPYLSAY